MVVPPPSTREATLNGSHSVSLGPAGLARLQAWTQRAKDSVFTGSRDSWVKWKTTGKTILREGVMQRGIMDTSLVEWSPEYLLLTDERLFIAHSTTAIANAFSLGDQAEAHGPVFDDILLRDVIECELKIDHNDPSDTMQVIFRTEEKGHNCGRSYVSGI